MPTTGSTSSTDATRVVVGCVLGAHGLKGEIRVRVLGDGPGHLLQVASIALASNSDDPLPRSHDVVRARPGRPGEVRLTLEGVEGRDAAAALRGMLVLADPASLDALPADEFYWFELVGCRVVTQDGETIGTVRELWETGAHDVLVVQGVDGRRRLVPTARELVSEIDLEHRRVVVDAIPGLLDPV